MPAKPNQFGSLLLSLNTWGDAEVAYKNIKAGNHFVSDLAFWYFIRHGTWLSTAQQSTVLAVSPPTIRRWRSRVEFPAQSVRWNLLQRLKPFLKEDK